MKFVERKTKKKEKEKEKNKETVDRMEEKRSIINELYDQFLNGSQADRLELFEKFLIFRLKC